MRGGSIIHEERVEFEPSALAYSSSATHLAVGDANAHMLRIYHVQVVTYTPYQLSRIVVPLITHIS
jgi:hypothetical protein